MKELSYFQADMIIITGGEDWLYHGFGGYDSDGNSHWYSGYTQDEFYYWEGD